MKLSLRSLSASEPSPETCEVELEMTIKVTATVPANTSRWALEKTAMELAGLDPRLVYGPFVSKVAAGKYRATVTVDGQEYVVEGLSSERAMAVEAIFAAASKSEAVGETEVKEPLMTVAAVAATVEPNIASLPASIRYVCEGGEATIGGGSAHE